MTIPRLTGARVHVRVPATTSNLGAGFDVFGMALTLYNEFEVEVRAGHPGCTVSIEGEGADTLPKDETNEVARVLGLSRYYQITIRQKNRIPASRGLGSSGAARLGAVLVERSISDAKRSDDWAVARACELEGHPDNVVPAFYGGAHLCLKDGDTLVHVPLREPKDLAAVVCIPDFEVSTDAARKVLPERYARADAVYTSSRTGLLVYAFEKREYALLRLAMQDVLHQPYRRALVPAMPHVIDAALAAGAFGAALSGSGPCIFALAPKGKGPGVGRAMQRAFAKRGKASRALVLGIDAKGASAKRTA